MELIYTSGQAADLYQIGGKYGSEDAAGLDLRAVIEHPVTVRKGEQVSIGTGIKLHMGSNVEDMPKEVRYAALVLPRSGLGTKKGLTLANHVGLIDQDYQGEIMCTMRLRHDAPEESYTITPGERIAQLVITLALRPKFFVVRQFTNITERGEAGHGSTGRS